MKAIGSLFGGGGGDNAAAERQRQLMEKQEAALEKREKEEKRRADARDRLLRATQGRSNSGTLFATSEGVDKAKVVG